MFMHGSAALSKESVFLGAMTGAHGRAAYPKGMGNVPKDVAPHVVRLSACCATPWALGKMGTMSGAQPFEIPDSQARHYAYRCSCANMQGRASSEPHI